MIGWSISQAVEAVSPFNSVIRSFKTHSANVVDLGFHRVSEYAEDANPLRRRYSVIKDLGLDGVRAGREEIDIALPAPLERQYTARRPAVDLIPPARTERPLAARTDRRGNALQRLR